jgi:ribonuclease T2
MRGSLLPVLAACSSSTSPPPPPAAPPPATVQAGRGEQAPTSFGLYVLALSWAPSFCCGHPDKEECANLATSYAGTHLTLHGLWPNFTDDEARGHATYPEFCGSYGHCKQQHDASCEPDPATLPAEMKDLGPGYLGDHDYLAAHEWPKHGSCTGLRPRVYFEAALGAMKAIPTPETVRAAIGGALPLAELQHAFGIPAESVLLSCDAKCRLSQISFCLAHDAKDLPTRPIACPSNTTNAKYDNGCVTRGCASVTIPAAGSCEIGEKRPNHDARPRGQHACNHPGQGPSCASDDSCVAAGFKRCARSGCCTSQP